MQAPAAVEAAAPAVDPIEAFHAGDPQAFLRAALDAEYELPEGDEHQQALMQEALDRRRADRIFEHRGFASADYKPTGKLNYVVFGRIYDLLRPRDGIFDDADA